MLPPEHAISHCRVCMPTSHKVTPATIFSTVDRAEAAPGATAGGLVQDLASASVRRLWFAPLIHVGHRPIPRTPVQVHSRSVGNASTRPTTSHSTIGDRCSPLLTKDWSIGLATACDSRSLAFVGGCSVSSEELAKPVPPQSEKKTDKEHVYRCAKKPSQMAFWR